MKHACGWIACLLTACTGGVVSGPDGQVHGDALAEDAVTDSRVGEVGSDSAADSNPDVPIVDAPLALAVRNVAITPIGSARIPDIAYDAVHDAYVVVYTWVPGPEFRTEARVVTIGSDGTPVASAPITVDPLATPPHNSADSAVAVAGRGSSAPALVVWSDDRLGSGNGQLDIYGQFLVIAGGASAGATFSAGPFRISSVDGTNESLPAVAWTGNGYYVAWADDRERGIRDPDARVVYGRTVALDGTIGTSTRLGDDTLFQTYPAVSLCRDRLLVAWTDYVAPGGPLVIQYRGRILDPATGTPLTPIFTIESNATVSPDAPGLACDAAASVWRVAWTGAGPPSVKQIHMTSVSLDGSIGPSTTVTMRSDGGLVPRLAWVPATGHSVLTFHAQDSNYGFAVDLGTDATTPGSVITLAEPAPVLGTFWSAIAAHATRPEAVIAATLDYNRVAVTVLRAVP